MIKHAEISIVFTGMAGPLSLINNPSQAAELLKTRRARIKLTECPTGKFLMSQHRIDNVTDFLNFSNPGHVYFQIPT